MAKNLLETNLLANELHESLVLTPISTNDTSGIELPGEKDDACRGEDENGSPSCCWTGRVGRWKPSVEKSSHTIDFCLDTSLHGLKYVGQPQRHFLERLFWFTSFVIGCVVAALLIKDIWVKYYTNPIVVTFYPFETTIEQIPFPAVTICNMNKVLKSKAEQFIEAQILGKEEIGRHVSDIIETEEPVYYLDQICSSSRSFSEKFNASLTTPLLNISYSPIIGNMSFSDLEAILKYLKISDYGKYHKLFTEFLLDNTQNCDDMILRCVWRNKVRNCSDLFKRYHASSFGTCCTFNMVPEYLLHKNSEDEEYKDEIANWPDMNKGIEGLLKKGVERPTNLRRQRRSGRSSGLSIMIDPSLSEYFCTDSDSEGFLLQTHLPIDEPNVKDFGIAIKPNSEVFINIKPEITKADEDIRSYRMDQRNCYFSGDFKLAYYKYYTKSKCVIECIANHTYDHCGCVPFYMPRDKKRLICVPKKLKCVEEKRNEFLEDGIQNNCSHCYPTCTELEYHNELTSTPLQTSVHQMANIYTEDDIQNGTRSNISIVHIYFGQDSTYPRYRTKLFGAIDLIANTGGLMGLCLGFSGLSLIECLYYFTLRAWCRTPQRRSFWSIMSGKFNKICSQDDP